MAERQLRTRVIRALGGATVAAALIGAGTALAADQSVAIPGLGFSPAAVTVTVGDSVTWTNSDDVPHTATANDASWDTGSIADGGTATVTFPTAGSFPYHCEIHPQMTGTVTVEAAASGGGGGGGGTATTPPTDAAPMTDSGPTDGTLAVLVIVGLAALAGIGAARRRIDAAR